MRETYILPAISMESLSASFGLSIKTITAWIKKGKLPAPLYIDRRRFYLPHQVEGLLAGRPCFITAVTVSEEDAFQIARQAGLTSLRFELRSTLPSLDWTIRTAHDEALESSRHGGEYALNSEGMAALKAMCSVMEGRAEEPTGPVTIH